MIEPLSEQVISGILKDARVPCDKKTVYKAVDYIDERMKAPDEYKGVDKLIEESDTNAV